MGSIDGGGTVHERFSHCESHSIFCGNKFACQFNMYCTQAFKEPGGRLGIESEDGAMEDSFGLTLPDAIVAL